MSISQSSDFCVVL